MKVIGRDIGEVLDERYQALERRLREDLARRLSQLRGVDVAPVDWGG